MRGRLRQMIDGRGDIVSNTEHFTKVISYRLAQIPPALDYPNESGREREHASEKPERYCYANNMAVI